MPTITVKSGRLEVSYEGEQAYIENGLLDFISALTEKAAAAETNDTPAPPAPNSSQGGSSKIGHTTSQVAQVTNATTGPDLAMAAMAHLTLAMGRDKVQRGEVLAEMRDAGAFYKDTYSSNLTSILNGLVKKKLLSPVGNNVFALPNAVRKDFEEKLAHE
jgi:hypothetical protein